MLHHVTLAYDLDVEAMMRILNVSAEKFADKAVRSARARVSPLVRQTALGRDAIVDYLAGYVADHCSNDAVRQHFR